MNDELLESYKDELDVILESMKTEQDEDKCNDLLDRANFIIYCIGQLVCSKI